MHHAKMRFSSLADNAVPKVGDMKCRLLRKPEWPEAALMGEQVSELACRLMFCIGIESCAGLFMAAVGASSEEHTPVGEGLPDTDCCTATSAGGSASPICSALCLSGAACLEPSAA
jgi:hypothetical protein